MNKKNSNFTVYISCFNFSKYKVKTKSNKKGGEKNYENSDDSSKK